MSLGQFFTRDREIDFMIGLSKQPALSNKTGSILEPACGNGAFLKKLPERAIGLELDHTIAPKQALVMNFFDLSDHTKFATVIGNPPYVANDKIHPETREKAEAFESWSGKTNLFVIFIEKCLNHLEEDGELIFIVPSIFLKATSCSSLNKRMYSEGGITDLALFGDTTPFGKDSAPEHETCIFRYEKGNFDRTTKMYSLKNKEIKYDFDKKYFVDDGGISFFFDSAVDVSKLYKIGDYFDVKVGAVTGLDEFFVDDVRGNKEYIFSKTRKTGKTRRMIDEEAPTMWLKENVEKLVARKIKSKWTHNSWWKWGRPQPVGSGKRIYVNNKTRVGSPFFQHSCDNYDGSVLAVFPKDQTMDLTKLVDAFNSIDWEMFSIKVGGRHIFKQRVLENCYLTQKEFQKCY